MNKDSNYESRVRRIQQSKVELRNQFWPNLKEENLWSRHKDVGFTTVPRTMTYIMKIIDEMSDGKPASSTYFALWCRVFDESLVVINNPREMAFESGFRGQRAEITWRGRMKILHQLKFIDAKEGASGSYHYVLILNPHAIIDQHVKSGKLASRETYNSFLERAITVGALK